MQVDFDNFGVDSKFFNDLLYHDCLEYIRIYLLIEKLVSLDDESVNPFISDLLGELKFLLLNFNISLMKLRGSIDDDGLKRVVDRFNYSVSVHSFAVVSDSTNPDFSIRVHNDDVDLLDDLLNGLHNENLVLVGANFNLNKIIADLVDGLDKCIDGGCDEDCLLKLRSSVSF